MHNYREASISIWIAVNCIEKWKQTVNVGRRNDKQRAIAHRNPRASVIETCDLNTATIDHGSVHYRPVGKWPPVAIGYSNAWRDLHSVSRRLVLKRSNWMSLGHSRIRTFWFRTCRIYNSKRRQLNCTRMVQERRVDIGEETGRVNRAWARPADWHWPIISSGFNQLIKCGLHSLSYRINPNQTCSLQSTWTSVIHEQVGMRKAGLDPRSCTEAGH